MPGGKLRVVASCTQAFAWLAVLMRCWVRLRLVKYFGLDDQLMVAAMLLFVWLGTAAIGTSLHGSGRHLADLTPADTVKALRYWWVGELGYCACTAVTKISICIFQLRIIVEKVHKYILYLVLALNSYSIFVFFLFLLQCKPVSYFWNQKQPGRCVNPHFITNASYVHAGICMATDLTLAILPIFLVWNLSMNRRTKVAVAGILGMGAIASIATCVRVPYLNDLANTGDFLWSTYQLAVWSTLESGIGIVAGSLPTLRPLFRIFDNPSARSGGLSGTQRELGTSSGSNQPKRPAFNLNRISSRAPPTVAVLPTN